MFDRYTETARRAVFFARYEVSQLGGTQMDTQHLLLGILQADRPLALGLLKTTVAIDAIRERIRAESSHPEKPATSVDLPLSADCKRVLEHAADESKRLNHEHIGPAHLLLGMLRETSGIALKILLEAGVTIPGLEQEAILRPPTPRHKFAAVIPPGSRDLTEEARDGAPGPLIGREREMESMVRILSRRTRNNVVLIGESGVGKNTIVRGLARSIADGVAPAGLTERKILEFDATTLFEMGRNPRLRGVNLPENSILYVQGLFDLAGKGVGGSALDALHALPPVHGVQCIATGTPFGLRLTQERAARLASQFEVVSVLPPKEDEAIAIVKGVKSQYEKFHGVVITDEAVEAAVSASRWFLRHRQLPDRAIDLIDEAAARVKLRRENDPPEIAEIQRSIRRIAQQMENAIANHEFTQAKSYAEEERRERETLQRIRGEPKAPSNAVTAEDVVETIAARANVPVSAVQSRLQVEDVERLDLVAKQLATQLPAGGEQWVDSLTAYLAGCSADEVDHLVNAIRAAKAQIDAQ